MLTDDKIKENWITPAADPKTFEIIQVPYFRDKENVFLYRDILGDADPTTFKILDNFHHFAKDKNYVYWEKNKIMGLNSIKTRKMGGLYYTDEKKVFFTNIELEKADPKTFTVITPIVFHMGFLAKDKKHVYNNAKIISKRAKSFKFVEKSLEWAVDKKDVFGPVIIGEDEDNCYIKIFKKLFNGHSDTFKLINKYVDHYFIYKNQVYFREVKNNEYKYNILEHADPKTIKLTDYYIAKDKYHTYSKGKKIK